MTAHGLTPRNRNKYCNKFVYNAGYKPIVNPVVKHKRDTSLLVGMELEIEVPYDNRRDVFVEVANANFPKGLFYHTSDCTVAGVEMTSVPVTINWLNAHREHIQAGFDALKEIGANIKHNCGGHIHASKKHITNSDARKILYLFCTEFNQFYPIVGRLNGRHQEWFNVDTRAGRSRADVLHYCKSTNCSGRWEYAPKLFTGAKTSEFRVFGGTIETEQLFSNLQLMDLMHRAAKKIPMEVYTWENLMNFANARGRSFKDMKRKLGALCAS